MMLFELQSIALDYAVPAVVVIGTGLISYMLTGGVDEYPSNNNADLSTENMNGGGGVTQGASGDDNLNNVRPSIIVYHHISDVKLQ